MEIHRLGPVWILVAHEAGARIFSRLNPRAPLQLIEKIDHPIGRAKDGQLKSDASGRQEEWGPSGAHHKFDKHVSPTEKLAIDFARELAERLDLAREQNRFDYLILVAGPKFLGEIQKQLSRPTAEKLVGTLNQNLGRMDEGDVFRHVIPVLEGFDRTEGLKSAV